MSTDPGWQTTPVCFINRWFYLVRCKTIENGSEKRNFGVSNLESRAAHLHQFIFCTPPNTQKWKMIFFYCKQLSVDELIMNVSIDHENDDKTNYVIILLPPFFSFVV